MESQSIGNRKEGRLAGALWLMVILLSIAAIIVAPSITARSSTADIQDIVLSHEASLRFSVAALFVGGLCYLGVTALLYELLKHVSRRVALFGALASVIGVALGGATTIHQMNALVMLKDAAAVPLTPSAMGLATIGATYLRPGYEFAVGMAYFGCHIASTGYLFLRSRLIPGLIGLILVIGGSTYTLTSLTMMVAPTLGARLSPIVIPIALLGEGSLTLWLLIKGVNRRATDPQPELQRHGRG